MLKAYLNALRQPTQTVNPVLNRLGIVVEEISAERAVLRLPFQPGLLQGAGVIAGGVIATLADEAMAHVTLANLGAGQSTATLEMSVRFLRPIQQGELRVVARLIKQGRKVCVVEAEITDPRADLIAKATASFMIVPLPT